MPGALRGRRLVVTRARAQGSGFAARLRKMGAKVLVCPTIRIVRPGSWRKLDEAVKALVSYDWLIFTSANGVESFLKRFRRRGDAKALRKIKACAIGPATAQAMRKGGIPVNLVSKGYVAESVLAAMRKVKGKRILIPRAKKARDVLPKGLRARGAKVDEVTAYKTVLDPVGAGKLRAALKGGSVDCVTFTSSSTVENFYEAVKGFEPRKVLSASIGPITTASLISRGWKPRIVARKPTTGHLAEAIGRYFNAR